LFAMSWFVDLFYDQPVRKWLTRIVRFNRKH
jgi:hypothetical protein